MALLGGAIYNGEDATITPPQDGGDYIFQNLRGDVSDPNVHFLFYDLDVSTCNIPVNPKSRNNESRVVLFHPDDDYFYSRCLARWFCMVHGAFWILGLVSFHRNKSCITLAVRGKTMRCQATDDTARVGLPDTRDHASSHQYCSLYRHLE